ncbi:F-box protein DOR-like [Juglans microcarpa x Juglans regia]|uniref:F-box protein DOR-like n=1 Tax=Juglans microcarpa x Juglans regia TaxID=2249226 RepID=UPI001B7DEB5A|nr:F-box protein DOR-like [Juglans microcarpa x Juglans regia]
MKKSRGLQDTSTEAVWYLNQAPARNMDIADLSEDLLIEILSRVPVETLHQSARYVCKTWVNAIRDPVFVRNQVLHAKPGLFVSNAKPRQLVRQDCHMDNCWFFEYKNGKFKLTDYEHEFDGEILGSSGGVALFKPRNNLFFGTLYVANPLTGKVMKLPRPVENLCAFDRFSSIAFIPETGELKVINPRLDSTGKYHWGIATVGVGMSWRRIDRHNSQEGTPSLFDDPFLYLQRPICVGGFLYSVSKCWGCNQEEFCSIHAIDIRDETTRCIQIPKELMGLYEGSRLMAMGNYLCYIGYEVRVSAVYYNVWILKDLDQNEWAKLYSNIDVGLEKDEAQNAIPIGWMEDEQELLFCVNTIKYVKSHRAGAAAAFVASNSVMILAYNVKTQKREKLTLLDQASRHKIQVHINSLLSWPSRH